MKNRKKLIKDTLFLFVTFGITAISASATDALPLKRNIQKGAHAASICINNHKQKLTPLKVNLTLVSGNKEVDPTSDTCLYCTSIDRNGYCICERLRCSKYNDNNYYRCYTN